MAAVVGHLGHDVSKDVVGCCDVCFAIGKLASENTPSDHGSRLPSRRLGSLHFKSVAFSCPPIQNIMAAAAAAAA
jgi:hypothetical protein